MKGDFVLSFIEKYDNGAWRIVGLIGEGSFGKVYKIVKEEFGYEYCAALKVISIPKTSAELDSLRAEGYDEAMRSRRRKVSWAT